MLQLEGSIVTVSNNSFFRNVVNSWNVTQQVPFLNNDSRLAWFDKRSKAEKVSEGQRWFPRTATPWARLIVNLFDESRRNRRD